jgi:Zn-dependent alcohol dehydrogenase
VIYHTAFALVYDESHEQAKWVAHLLLPDVATGTEGRTNDFRPDPLIKTGSAVDEDYARKVAGAARYTTAIRTYGHFAVQIAKLRGARVIGIAGGATKCAWVRSLGAEDCIDYRKEGLAERLATLCPAGIDIAFDNVGGAHLEAMIGSIAQRGRVVLCGQIAGYDAQQPPPGPRK